MRYRVAVGLFLLLGTFSSHNFLVAAPGKGTEKELQKHLEQEAKRLLNEARLLQQSGRLLEARSKYGESQSYMDSKDAISGLKHVEEAIRNRVKTLLAEAHQHFNHGNYQQAAAQLHQALQLQPSHPVVAYDLAVCYSRMGDRQKAVSYLARHVSEMLDSKLRQTVGEFRSVLITGENKRVDEAAKLTEWNHQITQLENGKTPVERRIAEDDFESSLDLPLTPASTNMTPGARTGQGALVCKELENLRADVSLNAPAAFDLANCAEAENRPKQAAELLSRYLELAPSALDAEEVRSRITQLQTLTALTDVHAADVQKHYASAARDLYERRYDRAIREYEAAEQLLPSLALTGWKLALLYESMGNVPKARAYFELYRQASEGSEMAALAAYHIDSLAERRAEYDDYVAESSDIISDLLRRSMNLQFLDTELNPRVRRARNQKEGQASESFAGFGMFHKTPIRSGGFTVPFGYARQQLVAASESVQAALALFPLGREANSLMAFIYLQALNGRGAIRHFDIVAGQNLPVGFYLEMRGSKMDRGAKCQLERDQVRFVSIADYDKHGSAQPPHWPAGKDGLGDLVPSSSPAAHYEGITLALPKINKVETKNSQVIIKHSEGELKVSPLLLTDTPPYEGPPARRFANMYTRLFIRYAGLEDSKLATEGLTGGEKFHLAMAMAQTAFDIYSSFGVAAIEEIPEVIRTTKKLQGAIASVHVNPTALQRSLLDQQQLIDGYQFKLIPTAPVQLEFME